MKTDENAKLYNRNLYLEQGQVDLEVNDLNY